MMSSSHSWFGLSLLDSPFIKLNSTSSPCSLVSSIRQISPNRFHFLSKMIPIMFFVVPTLDLISFSLLSVAHAYAYHIQINLYYFYLFKHCTTGHTFTCCTFFQLIYTVHFIKHNLLDSFKKINLSSTFIMVSIK